MTTISVPVMITFLRKKPREFVVAYKITVNMEIDNLNRYEDSIEYVGKQFAEYKKMANGKKFKNTEYQISAMDIIKLGESYRLEE